MSKRTQHNHVTLCVTLRAVYGTCLSSVQGMYQINTLHFVQNVENERNDYTVSIKLLIM